jgi:type I restriction enzyme S subunit
MKDSEVRYIGKIPNDWHRLNLKYIGFAKSGLGNKKPEDFGHGLPFISYKNIYSNFAIDSSYEDLVNSTDSDRENYSVLRGDAFFTGSSETIEELGMASMCLKDIPDATYNGFSIRFRPYNMENYYPEFMMYFFRSYATREHLVRNDNSITRANLSQKLLKMLPVILPPFEEQKKLANYLDQKVDLIDNIIEKTKGSIEEYKKYKQSLITETVTKGLNPDVKMKDSGIEWIGEVPEHWEVIAFKHILKERTEKNNPIKSTERLSLSIDKGVTLYSEKTTNLDRFKDDYSQYKLAYEGDFVMNSMNMIVGAVGISDYFGCVSPVYYTFYDNVENHYTAQFCEYLFKSKTLQNVLFSLGKGIMAIDRGDGKFNTVRLKVSRDGLRSLKLPIPKLSEQIKIIEFLNKKTIEIVKFIKTKELYVQELESYKKALIYEVVTGKKEIS